MSWGINGKLFCFKQRVVFVWSVASIFLSGCIPPDAEFEPIEEDPQQFTCSDPRPEAEYAPPSGPPTAETMAALAAAKLPDRVRGTPLAGNLYTPTPIHVSGRNENRIDIVFMGDGYVESEIPLYQADVDEKWATLLADDFFYEYQNYFNVHRIDLISVESGVDNYPEPGEFKNTILNMQQDCLGYDRTVCGNVSKAHDIAENVPSWDQIVAISNNDDYGGTADFADDIVLMTRHPGHTITHELGHSFGKLGDEYGEAILENIVYPEYGPESGFPNISKYADGRKWQRWLGYSDAEFYVDVFEGGEYFSAGVYRPTLNSRMRDNDYGFGPINTEGMIISLYQQLDAINENLPMGEYPAGTVLWVRTLHPQSYGLTIEWWIDGELVTTTSLPRLYTSAYPSLNDGEAHTVAVRVTDNTDKVRFECARAELMRSERIWTVVPSA